MDSAALLSPSDINTIRRYVHTKYAPLPGSRQAEIVADAIRRTLQQRLPGIPDEMKTRMVDKLISRCLVGEQRDVKPDDVLELCAEWHDDEADLRGRLLEPIVSWLNERSPGKWSPEQLAALLERRNDHSLALVQQIPVHAEPDAERWNLARGIRRVRLLVSKLAAPVPALALFIIIAIGALGAAIGMDRSKTPETAVEEYPPIAVQPPKTLPDIGMPERLKYTDIDVAALKTYLNNRESLLVEEPYFGAIIDSAREYDIHPLLLFAITGQEQGFVPKTGKDAALIANNPFNVGHSWMEYNTDIRNSAGIASRLIVKLAKSRPEGHEPFAWFNKTYAEDPKWSDGVRKIFNKLTSLSLRPPIKAE